MKIDLDTALTARSKCDRNRGLSTVLRQLRRNAGATQSDIAATLGLERTSVCNIESGIQALTIEKLHDFAERVGVEVVVRFRQKRKAKSAAAVHALGDSPAQV